jgi:hypothetical protein
LAFNVSSVAVAALMFLAASFFVDSYIESLYVDLARFPDDAVLVAGAISPWVRNEVRIRHSDVRTVDFHGLSADNSKEYSGGGSAVLLMPEIVGVTPNAFGSPVIAAGGGEAVSWRRIVAGRDISELEHREASRVVVISEVAAGIIFGDRVAVGQEFSLRLTPDGHSELFLIVGVYEILPDELSVAASSAPGAVPNLPQYFFVPEAVIGRVGFVESSFRRTIFDTRDPQECEAVRRLVAANSGAEVETYQSKANAINEANRNASRGLMVGVVAVLGLTGLGLLNSMLFSIRERTVEIGLKKAVGARAVDICLQFFGEALLVGVAGYLIGLVAAVVGAIMLQLVLLAIPGSGFAIVVRPTAVLSALLLVLLQTVIFSLIPALRAARVEVVHAIRFD